MHVESPLWKRRELGTKKNEVFLYLLVCYFWLGDCIRNSNNIAMFCFDILRIRHIDGSLFAARRFRFSFLCSTIFEDPHNVSPFRSLIFICMHKYKYMDLYICMSYVWLFIFASFTITHHYDKNKKHFLLLDVRVCVRARNINRNLFDFHLLILAVLFIAVGVNANILRYVLVLFWIYFADGCHEIVFYFIILIESNHESGNRESEKNHAQMRLAPYAKLVLFMRQYSVERKRISIDICFEYFNADNHTARYRYVLGNSENGLITDGSSK